MNRNILSLWAFLFTIIGFTSCKHDNFEGFVGPALCPTNNFKVIEDFRVSSPVINFNQFPGVYGDSLKAKFSEAVTWTISLKGQTSGATKSYKGRSAEIDTVWYGQSSNPTAFFQTGEDITVELSISCLSETYIKTIKLVEASKFATNVGPYAMVTDFDGSGYVANTTALPGYNAAGWSTYFTAPNVLSKIEIGSNVSNLSAPQGANYLTLQGTAGPTSWFVGGTYVNAPTSLPGSSPDSVYFNAYMSSGNNKTTTIGITLQQTGINYTYILPITWDGWKMVAIKLSDFKNGNGQSLNNLAGVTAIDFGSNCASKQGQSTEMDIDFIIFSNGGPFFQ